MIGKTAARKLKRILASRNVRASLQAFMRGAAPKSRPMKLMKKERLGKERSSREDRNAETARIRAECMKRAAGHCECGCGAPFIEDSMLWRAEMDEWLNGNGRRQQKRAVETCWMLTASCHRFRQRYVGGVELWNQIFEKHCRYYRYQFTPHIEHAAVKRPTSKPGSIPGGRLGAQGLAGSQRSGVAPRPGVSVPPDQRRWKPDSA